MKNLAIILSFLLIGFSANASAPESENHIIRGYDGNAFIFIEGNVEFSVFPDGQFDFVYIGQPKNNRVTVSTPNVNKIGRASCRERETNLVDAMSCDQRGV